MKPSNLRLAKASENIIISQIHQLPPSPSLISTFENRKESYAIVPIKNYYNVVTGEIEIKRDLLLKSQKKVVLSEAERVQVQFDDFLEGGELGLTAERLQEKFEESFGKNGMGSLETVVEEMESVAEHNLEAVSNFTAALQSAEQVIRKQESIDLGRTDGTFDVYPFQPRQTLLRLDKDQILSSTISYPPSEFVESEFQFVSENRPIETSPYDFDMEKVGKVERNGQAENGPIIGTGRISHAMLQQLRGKAELTAEQLELVNQELVFEKERNDKLKELVVAGLAENHEAKVKLLKAEILAMEKKKLEIQNLQNRKKVIKAKPKRLVDGQRY